ncbi:hypothetical protein O181_018211 [Austropuccinia psidii MF-1]|uniref:HPt domain-containing protein n=1 Tax=Austropuccinia psidii MF-1 TaxID=1389203 RepID=A0A9Q3GSQ5_9BASI|nr:hypothetical protein [Austropuccinia psidii MF-1]
MSYPSSEIPSFPKSKGTNQKLSSCTPGEGYPFPRMPRPPSSLFTSFSCSTNFTQDNIPKSTSHSCQLPSIPHVINVEVFTQLLSLEDEAEGQNFKFTKALLDLYYKDAKETLKSMRSAVQSGQGRELASLAHFLRGAAASIGIAEVASLCEEIEIKIMAQDASLDQNWFNFHLESIENVHALSLEWFRAFYVQNGA